MKPLVSILIPAYNASEWLAQTIQSALAQTWENKEIIIVDDGSKDDTLAVARRFESPTVRVILQKNAGAATARNTALAASRGDFIQWLDADDLLAPDKIALQMEIALAQKDPRLLLSGSWGHFIFRPGRAEFVPSSLWSDLTPAEFLTRKLEHRACMQTAVWLVSRELSEAAGPWNPQMISDDDGEYFCRVILASSGIRFVPTAKVFYRVVGSSSLSYVGRSDRKLEALWGSMQLHMGYLRSLEDSPRTRAACLRYLQNYLVAFYPLRPDLACELQKAAEALGGRLHDPKLPWKYAWIRRVAGWAAAKQAQILLPQVRWYFLRRWDLALHRAEMRKTGAFQPT